MESVSCQSRKEAQKMIQVHPSAVVHKDVQLGQDVTIGPNCVVEGGVSIGSGTVLGANVVIERDVRIGEGNRFYPNCVIGGLPQMLGLSPDEETGGLVIGNHNTIREQVTIHRSFYPGKLTEIGDDNFMMVGAHVGHDCVLEDKIVMTNCVLLSGHCKVEKGAWFSGLAAAHQFVTIGKWCYVAGHTAIVRDVPPFLIVGGGYPMRVRGVNVRGLRRAGFSQQQQQRIYDAYKKLYHHQGGTLLENTKALASEEGLDENVRAMIDAINKSSQHRFGRYLETFRHS